MSDSTTTVEPSSTVSTGGWTITGAGTAHAALSDASDSTYAEASTSAGAALRVGLDDVGATEHDLIRYIQPFIRAASPGGTRAVSVRLYGVGAGKQESEQTIELDATIRTYNLQAFRAWPNGRAFTLTDLANLFLSLYEATVPVGSLRVYLAGVIVVYNAGPTLVLDALTTPVTDNALGSGSWEYSDPEGDRQERYQERIYRYDPMIGWPSAGADTEIEWLVAAGAVPLRDVEVLSDATITEPFLFPPTGGFRRYLRAADRGSGGRYGGWVRQEWDMLLDNPPDAPIITVTTQPLAARVVIELEPSTGTPVDFYQIERSVDGGSWETVRGADPLEFVPTINRVNAGSMEDDSDGDGVANAMSLYSTPGGDPAPTGTHTVGNQRVSWTTNTGDKGLSTRPHVNPDGSNVWLADSQWFASFMYGSDIATLPEVLVGDPGDVTVTWEEQPSVTVGKQRYVARILVGGDDVESDISIVNGGASNHHFDISDLMVEHLPGSAGGGGYGADPYADIEYAGSEPPDPSSAVPSNYIDREAASAVAYDRFAPREAPLVYRARVVYRDGSGELYGTVQKTSAWTEATEVTLVSDGNSWLTSPSDDDYDMAFLHRGTTFALPSTEDQQVYAPDGRETPVVIGGTIHMPSGTVTLAFLSQSQWDDFVAVRARREPLLFRTLYGEGPLLQWWLRIGATVEDEMVGGYPIMLKGQLRRVTFDAYVTAEPE